MKALPLVTRELQAEARRPFNYWLRVLGGGIVVVAFTLANVGLQVSPGRHGIYLFAALNSALSVAIWILVPAVTADCISREKREGTLGLLFLTPLSASDILIGKALSHGARAFTVILAALPLLGLPFMLGGISWAWAINSTLAHLASLLLALSAGFIASVRNTEWTRALVTAELLSGAFAIAFGALGVGLWQSVGAWYSIGIVSVVLLGIFLLKQLDSITAQADGEPPPLASNPSLTGLGGLALEGRVLFQFIGWLAVGVVGLWGTLVFGWGGFGRLFAAVIIFLLVVRQSAIYVRETWQDDMGPPPEPGWVAIFSNSDFWQSLFHWNKSRTLDRNPIAWLQEYCWTARLTKWGWCMTAIAGELWSVLSEAGFATSQRRLSGLLMLGLAFSAAGSFRKERQTGALELLLVTPLRERHILGGRLWGIWGHFLPAMSITMVCWWMVPYTKGADHSWWTWGCLSSYVCLPLIGLFFSLRDINFLMAWLLTCAVGLLTPCLALAFFSHFTGILLTPRSVSAIQLFAAAAAGWLAYRSVRDRQFVTSP